MAETEGFERLGRLGRGLEAISGCLLLVPLHAPAAAIRPCVGKYATGVDLASDSKVPHLVHIAASAIILMDAEAAGTLIDDRFKIAG
ncbi:hypothetical protein MKK68_19550 [Methylobacterium sp. E-016]|uniref:hypothetical protein n=1 Tax=Methylobacterium sp. E-016 TaxID=2836556 RepID=UPI001FBAD4E0|nr:hypothetical protein [Methylobacterium sp. E-016]MCJ2077812.1 hypothetical protein [Methylobacterium sp. E-016]